MRSVQSSTGEKCEDWIPKEGQRAQPVESHHQVLRHQDHAVRGGSGPHGDLAQVRVLDVNNLYKGPWILCVV